jgi:hypothetical protein
MDAFCVSSAKSPGMRAISCHTSPFEVCPRSRVYRGKALLLNRIHLNSHTPPRHAADSLWEERERGREIIWRKVRRRSCGKPTALPSRNGTALKDFISDAFSYGEAVILGCCAVWFGNFFPTFRAIPKTPYLNNQPMEASGDFSYF